MDLELKGRTAVVTGTSIGIGRAIAKGLAQEGVSVVGVARRKELLDTLVQEVKAAGGTIIPLVQDLVAEGAAGKSTFSSTMPAAADRCRSMHPTAPGTKRSRSTSLATARSRTRCCRR